MVELPKRKKIRIAGYDYSTPGTYFLTVCIDGRKPVLWNVGAATCRQKLSAIGAVVERAILQIPEHYSMITVDKYCIMPDHIHILLSINTDDAGRQVDAPNISVVVGQMKRWFSMQVGYSVWQKSFIDRVIRNEKGYQAAWEYIENNPINLDSGYDMPDFDGM